MNTNQENFNEEIETTASSIKREFKVEVDTKKVITEFCNLFEKWMITSMNPGIESTGRKED